MSYFNCRTCLQFLVIMAVFTVPICHGFKKPRDGGSESPAADANGNTFDFTTKLIHLAGTSNASGGSAANRSPISSVQFADPICWPNSPCNLVQNLLTISRVQANGLGGGSVYLPESIKVYEQSVTEMHEVLQQQTEAVGRLGNVFKRDARDMKIIIAEEAADMPYARGLEGST